MSIAREPLNNIVVVGDGQLGALAALGLKKALPTANVTVVATPVDPANMADRAPSALPFTNQLHAKLGVAEEDILSRAGGSHRLITRLIIDAAAKAGVQYLAAPILGAEPDGQGGLARMKVEGHPIIEGDLFLDCSGPEAILRSAVDEPEAEDWSDSCRLY